MLLAVDIGNSAIKFGVFNISDCFSPLCSFSISNRSFKTSDEYELLINQMLLSKGFDGCITSSVISSVAPSVTASVAVAVASVTNSKPFIIGRGTHTGFRIRTDDPTEFGSDMVCNVAASIELTHGPIVIADLGTATTLAVVNADNELIGSIIVPGAGLSLDALSDNAELLNKVNFKRPDKLIGTNTAESIRSGIINGNVYMIDGFIRNIREQLCDGAQKLSLIATGGLNHIIIPYCRNKFTIVEDLTLSGAATLYKKNKNQL